MGQAPRTVAGTPDSIGSSRVFLLEYEAEGQSSVCPVIPAVIARPRRGRGNPSERPETLPIPFAVPEWDLIPEQEPIYGPECAV